MNLRSLILGLVLTMVFSAFEISNTIAQSEPAPYYFVTVDRDTTFCMSLDYGTDTKGFLERLTFIQTDGVEIDIKGVRRVPNIITFYMEGFYFDKIPFDLDSDYGEYIYSERKVDGAIKVYLDEKAPGMSPIYRFYVRLPDGSYLKVNSKSNMKKYITPALLQCEDFKDAYVGEYSNEEVEFINMVSFYNFLIE
jgi:hypothetical protein